uniref:RNA-binding S4 domain-containing protein n=1 Tax=uncultured Actinomycetes bacterium TaxID=152507 RepID=A0A871YCB7_9ACTN|nr:RNA-binding S4 domain-containing protein [uncultured Actinomycetes bacterium]
MPEATESNSVRVDVWTWAVRLFPTRSIAAAAARGGHIKINGKSVKPAQAVKVGDIVHTRLGDLERTVVVSKIISRRVGAAIAVDCYEDRTPIKVKSEVLHVAQRERGSGRPTKRDRRLTDRLRGF